MKEAKSYNELDKIMKDGIRGISFLYEKSIREGSKKKVMDHFHTVYCFEIENFRDHPSKVIDKIMLSDVFRGVGGCISST